MEVRDVRAFYDDLWQREGEALTRHERDRVAALLALIPGLPRPLPTILEAGCGAGKLAARLRRFGDVTALDWAEGGLEAARRRAPEVTFICADLVRDDLSRFENRFGLTVSSEVIEHVGKENRKLVMERLSRTLVPGGFLLLTTPNRKVAEALADLGALYQPEEDLMDPEETERLVREAGLQVQWTGSTTFLERLWESSSVFRRLRSLLPRRPEGPDVIDGLLRRTRLGFYFVVCARKGP